MLKKRMSRCGARHISNFEVKINKHTTFGALLEVEMSKTCTALWHDAHFEVKMPKAPHPGPFLQVEMLKKCSRLWRRREAHFQVKSAKSWRSRTTFGS